ncbi:MAG: hypothetical protein GY754_21000, partial [bacterium]|nr:hypothetical protein [bacterium]
MNIDTTINIDRDLLVELEAACRLLGKSRSRLIVLLMKRVMIEKEIPVTMFYRIRYQRCDEEKGPDWKRVHVYPPRHMYECFQDMRKIFKMSISAVI